MSTRRQQRQAQKQNKKIKQPSLAQTQELLNYFLQENYDKTISIAQNMTKSFSQYSFGWQILGATLKILDKPQEAINALQIAHKLSPNSPEINKTLGIIFHDLQREEEAIPFYEKAIESKPDDFILNNNLGNIFLKVGNFVKAEKYYDNAIKLKPDNAQIYNNYGFVLKQLRKYTQAEDNYLKAIELDASLVEAYNNLANLQKDLGRFSEAQNNYLKAIEIKPSFSPAFSNLANVEKDLGRFNEATEHYLKAIELNPNYVDAYNNLLFSFNYNPEFDIEKYLQWARKFGEMVSAKSTKSFTTYSMPKAEDKLKIGFVSGDFGMHPIGYVLESFVKYVSGVDLVAYNTQNKEDDLATKIKPYFKKWVSVYNKSDEELAHAIHKDNINILIDLSGHSEFNRLAMFAYKPAPITATWLGYFASTGMSEIDYFIGDKYVMPLQEKEHFIEKPYRIKDSWLCFSEPDEAPNVGSLPALENKYITFGCFGNLSKVNDEVISLWSEILLQVPNSKLFLKADQLTDKIVVASLVAKFEKQDIPQERLILEGDSRKYEYLASYNKVDILLDTFPYHGGTTSVYSLYMGVPIITLAGDRFLSRIGESIMQNVRMSEWIAQTQDEYVQKAIYFSENQDVLVDIRLNLRQISLASPLYDGELFASNFENAMQYMWESR